MIAPKIPTWVVTIALVVSFAATWAGTMMAPRWLMTVPLVVIALSPRFPFVALTAGMIHPVTLWVVLFIRGAIAKPVQYLAGNRFGPSITSWMKRTNRNVNTAIRKAEALVDRWGLAAIVIRNNMITLIAAGDRNLPPKKVTAAVTIGSAIGATITVASVTFAKGQLVALRQTLRPVKDELVIVCSTVPGAIAATVAAAATVWLVWNRTRPAPADG